MDDTRGWMSRPGAHGAYSGGGAPGDRTRQTRAYIPLNRTTRTATFTAEPNDLHTAEPNDPDRDAEPNDPDWPCQPRPVEEFGAHPSRSRDGSAVRCGAELSQERIRRAEPGPGCGGVLPATRWVGSRTGPDTATRIRAVDVPNQSSPTAVGPPDPGRATRSGPWVSRASQAPAPRGHLADACRDGDTAARRRRVLVPERARGVHGPEFDTSITVEPEADPPRVCAPPDRPLRANRIRDACRGPDGQGWSTLARCPFLGGRPTHRFRVARPEPTRFAGRGAGPSPR